jgi:hypothetical protein
VNVTVVKANDTQHRKGIPGPILIDLHFVARANGDLSICG